MKTYYVEYLANQYGYYEAHEFIEAMTEQDAREQAYNRGASHIISIICITQ